MVRSKQITVLIIVFLLGLITPFIPAFTVIEMFFLLIPFGLTLIGTLIYLIVTLLNKKQNLRKAFFIFSILPTFILSQFLSGFTIDKAQRYRCKKLIDDIEKTKNESGEFPKEHETPLGINYTKSENETGFILEYTRGFMVTEKYDSKFKKWKSYGWND